jgi:hypothetical protein
MTWYTVKDLIEYIMDQHIGEENAISWDDLTNLVNNQYLTRVDPKNIRDIIHELRKNQSLICSSSKGYYRPKDWQEVKEFTDRLRDPSRDQLATARILRDAGRRKFFGQLPMFK